MNLDKLIENTLKQTLKEYDYDFMADAPNDFGDEKTSWYDNLSDEEFAELMKDQESQNTNGASLDIYSDNFGDVLKEKISNVVSGLLKEYGDTAKGAKKLGMLQARKELASKNKDGDNVSKAAGDIYKQFDKDNGEKANVKSFVKGYDKYMKRHK